MYYVRQHTSAYVSIRLRTLAYVPETLYLTNTMYYVRQHTSAYVSIRLHTLAYVPETIYLTYTMYYTIHYTTSTTPYEYGGADPKP
jgi:flagellar biosynthesis protein FliQ